MSTREIEDLKVGIKRLEDDLEDVKKKISAREKRIAPLEDAEGKDSLTAEQRDRLAMFRSQWNMLVASQTQFIKTLEQKTALLDRLLATGCYECILALILFRLLFSPLNVIQLHPSPMS